MIKIWKNLLIESLNLFLYFSKNTYLFKCKLLFLFIIINIFFYWMAMLIAFPDLIVGNTWLEYFLLQFPVGILGGIFDSLSLIITIYMIKRAISSNSDFMYLAHLSIDLVVAFFATLWVLFVFIFSGWFIGILISNPENIFDRKDLYEERVLSALQNPSGNDELKNIFFGFVMGLSAMFPTTFHIYLCFKSIKISLSKKV